MVRPICFASCGPRSRLSLRLRLNHGDEKPVKDGTETGGKPAGKAETQAGPDEKAEQKFND